MKLLASGIVLIACCSALAQNLPPSYNSKTFSVFDVSKNAVVAFQGPPGNRVLFIKAAKNASGVTSGPRAVTISENGSMIFVVPSSTSAEMNKADSVQGGGVDLVQLRGNVEVHTTGTLVQADEVDYHLSTGQMELRGNVRLTPVTQ